MNIRAVYSWRRWAWVRRGLCAVAAVLVVGVILFLGVRQAREKVDIVRANEFVGHSDEASYALQGKGIVEGRGIRVEYVTAFMVVYPPGIEHREDHWPPFMGYAIAPCYWMWGVAAWVARLPEIYFGSVGLPLMAMLLTWGVSRRGYAGLVAGLVMMMTPQVYGQSMRVLSDVATAMLVAGFCGWVVWAGWRKGCEWMYVPAGIFLAGAYFAKESELILLMLFPLLAVMTSWRSWRVLKAKWFYAGAAAALLFMGPYWYANWRDYGNPWHTTQNYVASFYGMEPGNWERGMYSPYWGQDLPKVSDRWTKYPDYLAKSRGQLVTALQYVLAGASSNGDIAGDFGAQGIKLRDYLAGKVAAAPAPPRPVGRPRRGKPAPAAPSTMKAISAWHAPVWETTGLAGLLLLLGTAIAGLVKCGAQVVRWGWRKIRKRRGMLSGAPAPQNMAPGEVTPERTESRIGAILGVGLVMVVQGAFLAFFWQVDARFCFQMLPLMLALGCTMGVMILEGPLTLLWGLVRRASARMKWRWQVKWMRRGERVLQACAPAGMTIACAAILLLGQAQVRAVEKKMLDREGAQPPRVDVNNRYITTGHWLAENLPTAVVMCRNPWELLFYSGPGNKAVGLPYPDENDNAGAEKIFAIARYYGVTHILVDWAGGEQRRACLEPYIRGQKPGLKQVEGGPRDLYELDWTTLPKKTVDEVFGK